MKTKQEKASYNHKFKAILCRNASTFPEKELDDITIDLTWMGVCDIWFKTK